jgi:hypothetical protein
VTHSARRLAAAVLAVAVLALGTSVAAATSRPAKSAPVYQFGIDTYVTFNCQSAATMDQWATTEALAYKALGANSIGIGFPLYMSSPTSNSVYASSICDQTGAQSPTPAILSGIIEAVQGVGLHVLLRPMIDQDNLVKYYATWRGKIEPTNVNAWFASYLATLRPYLFVAQQDGVASFALATELDSLMNATQWPAAISLSHRIYQGKLVWDTSWSTTQDKVTYKGASFAVDAYPTLTGTTVHTTPAQLTTLWSKLLAKKKYKIPNVARTAIDEIGILAQDGAYAAPNAWVLPQATYPFNQKIQANWFTAACSFVKQHHMVGLYYWGPVLSFEGGALLSAPDASRPSDIQPLAQAAIKRCFG